MINVPELHKMFKIKGSWVEDEQELFKVSLQLFKKFKLFKNQELKKIKQ